MITTLLFDLGGTLHSVSRTKESRLRFSYHVLKLLQEQGITLEVTAEELTELLQHNAELYKHESEITLRELSSPQIWSRYYLKEFHLREEQLEGIADELSHYYDCERVINTPKPFLAGTLRELHEMGIRMGLISNIISTTLVPQLLKDYGIDRYMECVILSSVCGIRKPDPRIFRMALDKLGVSADEAGYVGDTISRDVLGTRRAGLGLSVQIENPSIAHRDAAFHGPDAPKADYFIKELNELPAIVRRLNGQPLER